MARELRTAQKLAVFAVGVAAAFGGGALVGSTVGPEPEVEQPAPAEHVGGSTHG